MTKMNSTTRNYQKIAGWAVAKSDSSTYDVGVESYASGIQVAAFSKTSTYKKKKRNIDQTTKIQTLIAKETILSIIFYIYSTFSQNKTWMARAHFTTIKLDFVRK